MDKYQDYVRAVRELGLQPLRIDEFESLTGAMSMSEIINLTAKKSGTDREELAEGTKKITLDDTPNFELEDLPKLLEEFELDLGRPPVSLDELKRHFRNKYGSDRLSKKETEPMMMASMDENEREFMRLVEEFMERGFNQQEAIDAAREEFDKKAMAYGGRVLKQTGGITESRVLPPEFIEAAQKTYLTDLSRQAGIPSITTAVQQQPGETAAQFAQRQAQAQQFGITRAGMAELAPQVAAQDPLQAAAYAQAIDPTKGLGSFQPFLTKAGTAADAATGLTGTGVPLPQGVTAGSIEAYMSPYQQQVIDTTMAEFDRQAQIRANQQAAATLGVPGAFGGGREGVQRAEYQAASDRNRAQTFANLQQQGFQNAAARRQQDLANQMGISNLQSGLGARAQDFSRAQISGLGTLGAAQQAQHSSSIRCTKTSSTDGNR